MYKAPRDKLVCILNCCKVINNLLLNASLASNQDHPGADEFLPVLIYVTIKANPPQLHSNLSYIQRFRRQTRMVSEAAYFFTNILSVESFITNIDAKALSMDETEYEKDIESAQALLSGLSETSDNLFSQEDQNAGHVHKTQAVKPKPPSSTGKQQHSTTLNQLPIGSPETKSRNEEPSGKDESSLNKIPSISDLENKGGSLILKEDESTKIFRDFPYLYSQAGNLTVGDVEDLLNNYKQIVFKYVCLAKGLGVTAAPPSSNTRGANLGQSETSNESVRKNEANPNDILQEEFQTKVIDDSGERLVSGLENYESDVPEENDTPEEGTAQIQSEKGDENSQR